MLFETVEETILFSSAKKIEGDENTFSSLSTGCIRMGTKSSVQSGKTGHG